MRIVEEEKGPINQPELCMGRTRLTLSQNEFLMIKNILDNTIREREQNLRERIANELNIDIEA